MTQQYLVGELSLRLARLSEVAEHTAFASAVTQLRRETETQPPESLSRPLHHALAICDQLCWESLMRGQAAAFHSQVAACADLYDFGLSANLLGSE